MRFKIQFNYLFILGGVLGLSVSAPSFASGAAGAKISALVQKELRENGKTDVLVLFKDQANLNHAEFISSRTQRIRYVYSALVRQANASQASLIKRLRARNISYRRFFISNALFVENVDQRIVNQIAASHGVGKVLSNPSVKLSRPLFHEEELLSSVGNNISATGADQVWKEFKVKGQNIVVAGQDTGYQWDHPALKNQYRGWDGVKASHDYNWHDSIHKPINPETLKGTKDNTCGYDVDAPCDDDRHGTHTMGTVVGSDGDENQIGVAPGAKWIGCRNMDAGFGSPASYLECFQFFLAPTPVGGNPFTTGRPEYAPHVINNSWGCPSEEGCTGGEILPALEAMKAAGILVVASAGNEGPGCGTIGSPPAHHTQYVLSVGAYNHRNGQIASFSSRGPATFDGLRGPDVVAPGVSIRSSVPGSRYDGFFWSGTSMAGPHVVGQVALMWSAQPNLIGKIDETIGLVRSTAQATQTSESCGGVDGSATPNNTFGYGVVRIYDSVKSAIGI